MTEQNRASTAASAQQVRNQSGKVTTADGLELHWQAWLPTRPRGVIVIIHGLAEHGARYIETAGYFAGQGWAVYVQDLRGHGLSPDGHKPGRVHVDDFSDYALDVDAIFSLARQQTPHGPCVILGHSMGGLIALRYTIDNPHLMDAVVISSPGLATHPNSRPSLFMNVVARILSRVCPRLLFPTELDTDAVCHDPEVVEAYIADPLVSGKVSVRWFVAITKAQAEIQLLPEKLKLPTLLMQSGGDRLVDPDATRRWAARAPAELIEFVMWDGMAHEMFNEPEKEKVRARVNVWLNKLF